MKILVEGIRIYAYHGCMEEETRIGNNYVIDVTIETDFSEAAKTDKLSKTIDYCEVYEVVKTEMEIPSKLIEHVAQRIINKIKTRFPAIQQVQVKLTKMNPPVKGDVEKVSVIVST